jgi:hypothetical protein
MHSSEKKLLVVVAVIVAVVALAAFAEYVSWAGELNSPLQPRESLVVRPSADPSTGDLLISVNNNGPSNLDIVTILFNETVVPKVGVTTSGSLTHNSDGSFSLSHGTAATIDAPKQDLGAVSSGTTYEVAIMTAMGNSYAANVTWP